MSVMQERLRKIKDENRCRSRKNDPVIIAEELLDWSSEEDSISIASFCAERGYTYSLIRRLSDQSIEFEDLYDIVKMQIAERRERLLNANLLDRSAYNRYQALYDPFLNVYENDEKDKDAKRKLGIQEHDHQDVLELIKKLKEGEISQPE